MRAADGSPRFRALPIFRILRLASLLALASSVARAQDSPAAARFNPPLDALSLPGVESPDIPPHLSWSLGASGATAHNLLMARALDGSRVGRVGWRTELHTHGSFAFFETAVLSFSMPGAVQVGTQGDLVPDFRTWATLWPGGPMDARAQGRLRLLRQDKHFLNASLGLAVTAPTSLGLGHLGFAWPTAQPAVLLGRDVWGARFMVNAGLQLRGVQRYGAQVFSDEAFVRAGAAYDVATLLPGLHLEPYVQGGAAVNLQPPRGTWGAVTAPRDGLWAADVGGGLRLNPVGPVQLFGGMDVAVLPAPGEPAWRVLAGLRWVRTHGDKDGDGIADPDDLCPTRAEDRDGYSDQDGCPEPDNDVDGIPDAVDRCPNWSEDLDGFEDDDGCSEPDNDRDGTRDPLDACPVDAGPADNVGCPAPDADGDGVLDGADACALVPEDLDGFEDADGCPDPDNDGDGVLDGVDACPAAPEDRNGAQDGDGCPNTDQDGDGVVDGRDRCPGVAGEPGLTDGCPL